ncbi:MAG: hypothetical protein V7731_01205 [Amphritea sp.]
MRYFLILSFICSFSLMARDSAAQETSGSFKGGSVAVGYDNRACSASLAGNIRYDSSSTCTEYCNGTAWTCPSGGGGGSSTPGYLVQTATTWDGNLGGLSGADAKCLTELKDTYGWKGKSDAGTLTEARVKAFLCDGSTCNNAQADTYYITAWANNTANGGLVILTDSNGRGPGLENEWQEDNFDNLADYWTARGGSNAELWDNTPAGLHCSNWSSNSIALEGTTGGASRLDFQKWNDGEVTCDFSMSLLCIIAPE